MGSPIMSTESPWANERFGPRGARLALLTSGLIFMVLIGGWAGVEIAAAWHDGRSWRAAGLGLVALLLLLLALRIMSVNWRATRNPPDQPVPLPDGNEQTGIWGIGGPSMREPGSTGSWEPRIVDRRYESGEE